MLHKLCLALGEVHPEALAAKLTASQLADWIAYNRVEPFGEERADLRTGILASVNANLWSTKGGYKPAQFMPVFEPQEQKQSAESMKSALIGLTKALGGTVYGKSSNNQPKIRRYNRSPNKSPKGNQKLRG